MVGMSEVQLPVISREEAIASGATHYFTGVSCFNGHLARRSISNRRCQECARIDGAARYIPKPNEQRNASIAAKAVAKANGESTFFSGFPCKYGHMTYRYVVSGGCVECYCIFREKNGPRLNSDWHEKNKNKRSEYDRIKRKAKPEHYKAKDREWSKANPGACAAKTRKRDAAKLQATPPWSDLAAIKQIYIESAAITDETGIRHQVDHIIPLQGKTVCGLHIPVNLQILTMSENARKCNKIPEVT